MKRKRLRWRCVLPLGLMFVTSLSFSITSMLAPGSIGTSVQRLYSAVAQQPPLPSWRRAGSHGNITSARNISRQGEGEDVAPMDRRWICADGKPRTHLVYIKTHKTGSSTLSHIIGRYGYSRNLSFALKATHRISGHFMNDPVRFGMEKILLPHLLSNRTGNTSLKHYILNLHIRFNRTVMDSFMALPTRYITTLRDPGYQFESGFVHFNLANVLPRKVRKKCNSSTSCLIEHFLDRGSHYWGLVKSSGWFWAKNNLMYDLGLDHPFHTNQSVVSAFIEQLDAELDLVLITDYYDESLLLLRKLMCWDWHDIVYAAENVRTTRATMSDKLRNQIREWSSVDMQLYRHFIISLSGIRSSSTDPASSQI